MKIQFEDSSYIECRRENDKIVFIIQAKDHDNHLKKITNIVEITEQEFKRLISDV